MAQLITTAEKASFGIGLDVDVQNSVSKYNRGEQGVYGEYPLMTPKYARNKGLRDNEFKETLARFYISLGGDPTKRDQAIKNYLASVPTEARALAKVLVGARGPNGGTGFIDFFLSQVSESFSEVAQVDKVLSDNYVAFFFGSEPPVFQYAGTLLNSAQDDHRIGMAIAYQHLIRGTQLARRGALLRLRYDDVIVSGTIMNMTQTLLAENELAVPFNFSLLVKEYLIILTPAKVTAKVEEAFANTALFSDVGTVSNIRSKTLAAPTKLSQTSTAGDDQDVPSEPSTPAEKVTQAQQAAQDGATSPSDISTPAVGMSVQPLPAPIASFPQAGQ